MFCARNFYVQSKVVEFYKLLPPKLLKLPFDIVTAANYLPDCKVFSYNQFGDKYDLEYDEVCELAESKNGCTKYKKEAGKYLILYNNDTTYFCGGRIRFTLGHEVGHVMLKHIEDSKVKLIAEHNLFNKNNVVLEREADLFSSTVLSPFSILSAVNITSSLDIMNICNISAEAAECRYQQYQKWLKYNRNKYDLEIYDLFNNACRKNNA